MGGALQQLETHKLRPNENVRAWRRHDGSLLAGEVVNCGDLRKDLSVMEGNIFLVLRETCAIYNRNFSSSVTDRGLRLGRGKDLREKTVVE